MQPLMDEHFVDGRRRGVPGISDRDVRMALAVVFELSCDARTQREPIRVSAQNGVVILAGTVSSREVRRAAAAAARAAVRAADVCNVLQFAADAPGALPADDFDQLVAAVDASRPEREACPVRGQRRKRRVALAIAFGSWLLLPPLIVIAGIPGIPALLVVLAITAVALLTRLFHSPGLGAPPVP